MHNSEIAQYLAQLNDPVKIQQFLESILTSAEMRDLDLRWELVKMLKEGKSQRQIAGELHISLCKITRGSRELKKKNSILKEAIERFT
jgi:TrpR family trp operon transcriptional repressor